MAAMNDPLAGPTSTATAERYVPGSGETRRHVLAVIVNNQDMFAHLITPPFADCFARSVVTTVQSNVNRRTKNKTI